MCELYMAYANIDDLISFSEKMFGHIFKTLGKNNKISYQGNELDFSFPWKQIFYVESIKEATGLDVLKENNPETYIKYLVSKKIDLPETTTLPALVDTIFKEL